MLGRELLGATSATAATPTRRAVDRAWSLPHSPNRTSRMRSLPDPAPWGVTPPGRDLGSGVDAGARARSGVFRAASMDDRPGLIEPPENAGAAREPSVGSTTTRGAVACGPSLKTWDAPGPAASAFDLPAPNLRTNPPATRPAATAPHATTIQARRLRSCRLPGEGAAGATGSTTAPGRWVTVTRTWAGGPGAPGVGAATGSTPPEGARRARCA